MRIHEVEPTMEKLRVTFFLRNSRVADHYYGYRFTVPVIVGLVKPKN